MSQCSYAIIGKGGLFHPIREILWDQTFRGYYDDRASSDPEWLGGIEQYASGSLGGLFVAIAAVRNMPLRKQLLADLNGRGMLTMNAKSRLAYVARSAVLGSGNVLCPLVCIHSRVAIGYGCVLFSNTVIEHDSSVGNNVNIAPGVTVAGSVRIGDDCFIGAGSVLRDGITVGPGSVIGAGSVVLKSVPGNVLAYGNPARVVRENDIYEHGQS